MKIKNIELIGAAILFAAVNAFAASPSYENFNPGDFQRSGNSVRLKQTLTNNITGTAATATTATGISGAALVGMYAYPRPTTNVSTAADLIAAVNYSAAGTVVGILPGNYEIGTNNLVPPDGVSVVGTMSGRDVILSGYADCWGVETFSQPTGGPQFSPGNNQFIGGFTIRCNTNAMLALYPANYGTNFPHSLMWAGFGMSVANPPTNRKANNTVVRNVTIERGYFDAFHFNNNWDKQNEITFIDCHAETEGMAWDFWSATNGGTNSVYNLINCSGVTRGNFPARIVNELAFLSPSLIFAQAGVTVNALNFRGSVILGGGAYTNSAFAVDVDAQSQVMLDGGKITVSGITRHDYTNSNLRGSFTFNSTNINRSPIYNDLTVGVKNGFAGFVVTNQTPSAFTALRLGVDDLDATAFALYFLDDLSAFPILKFYPDKFVFVDRDLYGNATGLTNLPVTALRRADDLPLTNGLAGMVLGSLGTGGAYWKTNREVAGGNGIVITTNPTTYSLAVSNYVVVTNLSINVPGGGYLYSFSRTATDPTTSIGMLIDDGFDRYTIWDFTPSPSRFALEENSYFVGRADGLTNVFKLAITTNSVSVTPNVSIYLTNQDGTVYRISAQKL